LTASVRLHYFNRCFFNCPGRACSAFIVLSLDACGCAEVGIDRRRQLLERPSLHTPDVFERVPHDSG
jgi:hypothetical protein